MSLRTRGLLLALLHLLLVASLGAKLLQDRRSLPRVWVETAPYDPNLPIRGRYVRLRLVVRVDRLIAADPEEWKAGRSWGLPARLRVENGELIAVPPEKDEGERVVPGPEDNPGRGLLEEPVAFFIPERAADPSVRGKGEVLWVEVTLPRAGPPRPIRLGVRKDGALTPIDPRRPERD